MAHFARLNAQQKVTEVLVVSNTIATTEDAGIAFLDTLFPGGRWKQTSYHGTIRHQFAGVGYTYDLDRDVFIAPQPFPSWILNEVTYQWRPPIEAPKNEQDERPYAWNESTQTWIIE